MQAGPSDEVCHPPFRLRSSGTPASDSFLFHARVQALAFQLRRFLVGTVSRQMRAF